VEEAKQVVVDKVLMMKDRPNLLLIVIIAKNQVTEKNIVGESKRTRPIKPILWRRHKRTISFLCPFFP